MATGASGSSLLLRMHSSSSSLSLPIAAASSSAWLQMCSSPFQHSLLNGFSCVLERSRRSVRDASWRRSWRIRACDKVGCGLPLLPCHDFVLLHNGASNSLWLFDNQHGNFDFPFELSWFSSGTMMKFACKKYRYMWFDKLQLLWKTNEAHRRAG